jgi:hypothetical protein
MINLKILEGSPEVLFVIIKRWNFPFTRLLTECENFPAWLAGGTGCK